MGKVIRDGCAGGTDVQHGDIALHFVMSGLVEEVAESDHASGFAGEVHGESRGTAAEYTSDRVQFLSASAQIVFGYDEIGGAEGGTGGKEDAVLAVPETVAGRFGKRSGLVG